MNEAIANLNGKKVQPIRKYFKAGLLAGGAAALLNILIYLILIGTGGYGFSILIIGSILLASLLPNLLAALAYLILSHLTHLSRPLLTLGIVAFVLISILPHFGIGPAPSPALAALPDGFDLLTVPLHIVFGLSSILILPWLADKS